MIRKREHGGENRSFTCPNPACGRFFDNPIRAENHSAKKTERYDACPYCLTDLTVLTTSKPMNDELELESDKTGSESPAIRHAETKVTEPPAKTRCKHEFGYLSKRGSKGEIPEECVMCESIVPCMLKTITG